MPIVGCEPSCLLTLVDEYRDFRLGPDADAVADASMLIDRFVADPDRVPDLPLPPRPGRVLLHGHCQQKALVGTAGTVAALRRVPGLEVEELDSGCCGMAGSFGYERGHYDVSVALAERVLLPVARERTRTPSSSPPASPAGARSTAWPGSIALHPIELIAESLATAGPGGPVPRQSDGRPARPAVAERPEPPPGPPPVARRPAGKLPRRNAASIEVL